MVYYDEDKLRAILYEEFKYKKIDEYGGKQTVEYWGECRRVAGDKLRSLKTILDNGGEVKELEEGYLEKLSKERDERLRKEKEGKKERLEPITPPIVTPPKEEPKRSKWRFFGGGRKQRGNKD